MFYKNKLAFTLVELIVSITIIAILGLISFITYQSYSKEARDVKRINDLNSLYKKINLEITKGTELKDLLIYEKTNTGIIIDGKENKSYQGIVNFEKIKENGNNFKDPLTNEDYPFAYANGYLDGIQYKFIQLATLKEKTNSVLIIGNYSKINIEEDSESLLKDNNGNIIENGSNDFPNNNDEDDKPEENKYEWKNYNGGYVLTKTKTQERLYGTECNDFITNPIYYIENDQGPYKSNKFIDGIYYIKPNALEEEYKVYCDMNTDNGGWTLAFYGNNTNAEQNLTLKQTLTFGENLNTYTSNPQLYPTIKNGTKNTFSQLLFKGGNANWQKEKGAWSRIGLYPAGTNTFPTTFQTAYNANGSTTLYLQRKGWGVNTQPGTYPLSLWNSPGVSNICGGADAPGGTNCPYFWSDKQTLHLDNTSHRELYYRGAKCIGELPKGAIDNSTSISNSKWIHDEYGGACTFKCEEGLAFNGTICEKITYGWTGNSVEGYKFLSKNSEIKYPKFCNDLLLDTNFQYDQYGVTYISNKFKNGIYYIKPNELEEEYKVYCDMNTDNGGWTLAFYGNNINSAQNLTLKQVLTIGENLKTYTSNPSLYPTLKNGTTNIFNQLLFKGGNANWQKQVGSWSRIGLYPAGTNVFSTTYESIYNANASTNLYMYRKGWGESTQPGTNPLSLWNSPGVSNICGGAGVSGGSNCPYFGSGNQPVHLDNTSQRELYYRFATCIGDLPKNSINNSTNISNTKWIHDEYGGACTFKCEEGLAFNGTICEKITHGWTGNSVEGYKFLSKNSEIKYPKFCNELITDTNFQYDPYRVTYISNKFNDGIYYIKPDETNEAYKVYCDMTTDNGGWTLSFYGNNSNSAQNLTINDTLISGKAIKTYSENPNKYPCLKNQTINQFDYLLFKGGNSNWQKEKGAWSRIGVYPEGTTTISNTLSSVLNANKSTTLYITNIGWGAATVGANEILGLWNSAGISNICGGANVGAGKNCPYFAPNSSSYHNDSSSTRFLFYK